MGHNFKVGDRVQSGNKIVEVVAFRDGTDEDNAKRVWGPDIIPVKDKNGNDGLVYPKEIKPIQSIPQTFNRGDRVRHKDQNWEGVYSFPILNRPGESCVVRDRPNVHPVTVWDKDLVLSNSWKIGDRAEHMLVPGYKGVVEGIEGPFLFVECDDLTTRKLTAVLCRKVDPVPQENIPTTPVFLTGPDGFVYYGRRSENGKVLILKPNSQQAETIEGIPESSIVKIDPDQPRVALAYGKSGKVSMEVMFPSENWVKENPKANPEITVNLYTNDKFDTVYIGKIKVGMNEKPYELYLDFQFPGNEEASADTFHLARKTFFLMATQIGDTIWAAGEEMREQAVELAFSDEVFRCSEATRQSRGN